MWFQVLSLSTILYCCSAEIAVLILARGGSKGLRLKNLRKVGGTSLLSRTIHSAKAAGLHDITVSTDHPLIALEAVKDNVTEFRRSFATATDWAPSIWGALEFLEAKPNVTVLILMQTTSPFTQPADIRSAVEKLNNPVPFDCVFSVTRSNKLRWRLIKGKLHPANFQVKNRVRRQDWDGEFLETGAFYITRRWLLENGQFQNYKQCFHDYSCTVQEVSGIQSLEVDTLEDLRLANTLLNANLGF
ncbi:N-acylneuraminate cytidylyltransferase [Trichoplusia ni]|uniref:N-acylneuraminate cytidylyltransferase n=1 Tax=Trichoplusia ni TaxID=7111 RepID=A0A7E5X329_TRINI|nr:N-acylneuraminate cytidylyltransferase [Trichoplusia ni]